MHSLPTSACWELTHGSRPIPGTHGSPQSHLSASVPPNLLVSTALGLWTVGLWVCVSCTIRLGAPGGQEAALTGFCLPRAWTCLLGMWVGLVTNLQIGSRPTGNNKKKEYKVSNSESQSESSHPPYEVEWWSSLKTNKEKSQRAWVTRLRSHCQQVEELDSTPGLIQKHTFFSLFRGSCSCFSFLSPSLWFFAVWGY